MSTTTDPVTVTYHGRQVTPEYRDRVRAQVAQAPPLSGHVLNRLVEVLRPAPGDDPPNP